VQDDYLDAFGAPEKFGKQVGGDIIANKKTFLMIHAMEVASEAQKNELTALMNNVEVNKDEKINRVLEIFKNCKVDEWAQQLKENTCKLHCNIWKIQQC
jgi:geranylgeranyl diphosphate synthase type II